MASAEQRFARLDAIPAGDAHDETFLFPIMEGRASGCIGIGGVSENYPRFAQQGRNIGYVVVACPLRRPHAMPPGHTSAGVLEESRNRGNRVTACPAGSFGMSTAAAGLDCPCLVPPGCLHQTLRHRTDGLPIQFAADRRSVDQQRIGQPGDCLPLACHAPDPSQKRYRAWEKNGLSM